MPRGNTCKRPPTLVRFRSTFNWYSRRTDSFAYLNEAEHTAVVCTRGTVRRTSPSAVQYSFVLYAVQLLLYASTYTPPESVFVSVQVRPFAFARVTLA